MQKNSPAETIASLFSESGFDDKIPEAAEQEGNLYLYTLEEIVNCKL